MAGPGTIFPQLTMASKTLEPATKFPTLSRPPIVEVVCGVVFESIPALDALELGVYWNERREDFPKKALQPALLDGPGFGIGIGIVPMRAMLASPDDSLMLQLQYDRFYLNWRATGSSYPSFSGRNGQEGLKHKALKEHQAYMAFCKDRFGKEPSPVRIELAKIDQLVRGRDWADIPDLARLLPITGTFHRNQPIESRDLNLRFAERTAAGERTVFIGANATPVGDFPVRIETRMAIPVTEAPGLDSALTAANRALNEAFFQLIPSDQLARFEDEGNP